MKIIAKGWEQSGEKPEDENSLSPEALAFVKRIDYHFGDKRIELLKRRKTIEEQMNHGHLPSFLSETKHIREGDWTVGRIPKDVKEMAISKISLRSLHLEEKTVLVDGNPISASFFDFANHFFYQAKTLIESGSGPYFFLPTIENSLEARLWNDVFVYAQNDQRLPLGTIKVTAVIDTSLAIYEMDEILYELKEHCIGLQLGDDNHKNSKRLEAPFMNAHSLARETCKRRALVIDNRTAEITHT